MRAAVYYGPNLIKVEDVPPPKIESDEYLLRVTACGLCKTDVKKITGVTLRTKGILRPPRVFGHEIVGEIEKLGSHLSDLGLREGDRVVIFHHVPCLQCYYCLHGDYAQCKTYRSIDTTAGVGEPSGGGFAQYVKVPNLIAKYGTIKIPDEVSDKKATFVEPTNCCLKGVRKADIQFGDYVAVFGQGPIGLTLDQLCKLKGAHVVTVDLVSYRLEEARKKYGADFTVNAQKESLPDKVLEITSGRGVDISIVAVESPKAVEQAINVTRGGGKIIFFAEYGGEVGAKELGAMVDLIYGKEITVQGCYSSSYTDHQLSADLVFKNMIKTEEMISHVFGLSGLLDAVNLAEKRRAIGWEGEKLAGHVRRSFKIIIDTWK